MFNFAHTLDDLVEAVLKVKEKAVPSLGQGGHQS